MGLTPRHTAALAGLLLGTAAVAQPPPPPGLPQPRITAALPAGAKAGTTVEVAVTGTDLDAPAGLVFSHPGITAEAVRTPEPKPDPKKKPAAKKAAPTPATAAFKVSVAAGVPAGWYDVRVSNKWGVSSPRAFVVGTRPEVNEAEPNNDVPEAQRITLGTVVNGVIAAPTDVDYTVFAGKAGERVTLTCQSGAIDGRARPLVELFTADGRRVAGGRASVDGDVTVEATLPAAGDYYVRVCEFAYQTGGADHFYRLTVGGDPGRSGHIPPAMAFHDGVVSTLPAHAEKDGPNDTAAAAEVIPVPCEVVGRFGRPGDRDVFKFAAKKGEPLVLELLAERLGGPNDVFLRVRDSAGKDLLGDLDDDQDSLHPTGFVSRSSDPPAARFTPPADGTYFAVVGAHDSSTVFGPRAAYRLRVRRPTPDFRAVVMARSKTQPDAPVLRAGGTTSVDVLVHRIDGFAGPVTLTAADLPPGVTAKPGLVGTGQRYGTLVLSAAATVKEFTGPVRVVCEAQADAGTLIRDARPASVTWGLPANVQNVPTVGRLDRQLVLAVRPDKAAFRLIAEADPKALTVKPGTKVTVPVRVEWQRFAPRKGPLAVQAEPTQPGQNQPITVTAPPVPPGQRTATVTLDVRANTPPGRYAVVLRGESPVPDPRNPQAAVTAIGYADALEVTVLPKK